MHAIEFLKRRLGHTVICLCKSFDEHGIFGFSIRFKDGNPLLSLCNGPGGITSFKGAPDEMKLSYERILIPENACLSEIDEVDSSTLRLGFGESYLTIENYGDELRLLEFSSDG